MSHTRNSLNELSLGELRRLLALRDRVDAVTDLMEKRDQVLGEARLLENQIEELLTTGKSQVRTTKPRGPSVRKLCEEVLRRKTAGLTPAKVKDAILKRYPERNSRTFYNQVFIALTRNDSFRRMADGTFRLRKSKAK